jgi:thioredoxin 1
VKKINILTLILVIAPIFSLLLFSQKNTNRSEIVYLHEHQNKATSSMQLLTSFSSTGNVILQFYADWCNPCKRMSPIINNYAATNPGFTFIKINRDFFKDLAQAFKVTSIPTLIFLRNGKEIGRYDGGPLTETTLAQLLTRTYQLA